MDDPTPFILIELVLTFGGVLLFAWWQLRELNQRAAAREKAREQERQREQQDDRPRDASADP